MSSESPWGIGDDLRPPRHSVNRALEDDFHAEQEDWRRMEDIRQRIANDARKARHAKEQVPVTFVRKKGVTKVRIRPGNPTPLPIEPTNAVIIEPSELTKVRAAISSATESNRKWLLEKVVPALLGAQRALDETARIVKDHVDERITEFDSQSLEHLNEFFRQAYVFRIIGQSGELTEALREEFMRQMISPKAVIAAVKKPGNPIENVDGLVGIVRPRAGQPAKDKRVK